MINKVILIGNLGRDPELRHLESGSQVAEVPLATNENYKDKNDEWQKVTEWHNLKAWGRLADILMKFPQGHRLYIEGKIKYRKWEADDGSTRYSTDIIVNLIRSLDKIGANDQDPGSGDTENMGDLPF